MTEQSVGSRLSNMGTLGPSAIGKKLHGTGGLGEGDAESTLDAFCVESEQTARSCGGPENATGRGRVKSTVVVIGGVEREGKAHLHFIACHASCNQIPSRGRSHFRCGQGRRKNGCGGMQ